MSVFLSACVDPDLKNTADRKDGVASTIIGRQKDALFAENKKFPVDNSFLCILPLVVHCV